MSHNDFDLLLSSIAALTANQVHRLRSELDRRIGKGPAGSVETMTAAEQTDLEVQERLLEAGLVSEIKPPIRNAEAYRGRRAVLIQGAPLSETVIRDRG